MSDTQQSRWTGWAVFGGIVMIIAGAFDVVYGLAALIGPSSTYFLTETGNLWLFDITAWGWWHLIFGVLMALAGVFLLRGATWARAVAVVLVSINAVSQLATLPYQPLWALAIIALDLLVIYAVVVHGRELTDK